MKYLLFFLIYFSSGTLCFSQIKKEKIDIVSKLETAIHTIYQKEGTNQLLLDYLGVYAKQQEELYVVLFSPQMCPRCEADIPYYFKKIKEIRPGARMVLVAVKENGELARQYVKEHFGTLPLIVDTKAKHKEIFHYGAGRLGVTFLLKIDCRQGRLMIGGDLPVLSDECMEQFCSNNSYFPYHSDKQMQAVYANRRDNVAEFVNVSSAMPVDSVELLINPDYPLSAINNLPVWNGNRFLYCDELLSLGLLYAQDAKDSCFKMKKVLKPTSRQELTYSKIPLETVEQMKKNGQLFVMASNAAFIPNNGKAVISYSLPDLSIESDGGIAYYNKPSLLVDDELTDSCRLYTYDGERNVEKLFMYLHAVHLMPLSETTLMLGCKKGMTPNLIVAPEFDPFEDAFYKETPLLALFDIQKGKLLRRLGRIGDICKQTHTGYFFVVPRADVYDKQIAYTDGCSGKVWVSDFETDSLQMELSLFDVAIPDGLMNGVESLLHTHAYYDRFFALFHRFVEDVKMDDRGVHCLVRIGKSAETTTQDVYIYKMFGHDGKGLKGFRMMADTDATLSSYGLGKDDKGHVFPFVVSKKRNSCWLKKY